MCGSKCAWCKNSTPTENGGWKCPWVSCHLSEYEIKEIMLRLAGTRKCYSNYGNCFFNFY